MKKLNIRELEEELNYASTRTNVKRMKRKRENNHIYFNEEWNQKR